MGSGEFGSNGSVHWRIDYEDGTGAAHVDYDTKFYDDIGANKNHKGKFRVTARYNTYKEALAAVEQALKNLQSNQTDIVQLDVDLRPETSKLPTSQDCEIKVDW